jgi:hypothetical protein
MQLQIVLATFDKLYKILITKDMRWHPVEMIVASSYD